MAPKMVKIYTEIHQMQWSWKESNGLERTIYVPYFDRITSIFNKNWGKWSWKNSKIPSFAVWRPYRAKLTKYAGDLTYLTAYGWAYTSYDPLLYTSLRLRVVFLCVHGPLPDPWLSRALIEPVVCTKILSSCSYPPGHWCNCEHWKMACLFSFSLTGLSLLMPREEQVQRCHHVSYTNKCYSIYL